MQIIEPSFELIIDLNPWETLNKIEKAARVCYKSEMGNLNDSMKFIKSLIKRGHESPLEHSGFTVKFICDRGISHELVRHRVASYCQESTRYCNYSKNDFHSQIAVIKPLCIEGDGLEIWKKSCEAAEKAYFDLLNHDYTSQDARAVLPACLKTEIYMTANVREWRHFLKLRTSPNAHPEMRRLTIPLLQQLKNTYPILFDDI